MKYIKKNIKNEPPSLSNYRNTTPNASYGGYIDKDVATEKEHPLKQALLNEQGYLCAYCMGEISLDLNEKYKPKVEVEHFSPQDLNPALDLDYNNMLGVCNGLSISYPENEQMNHCDKTKGQDGKMNGKVVLKKLDPRKPDCEKLVKYTLSGELKPVNDNDTEVVHDLNKVLNLNNPALVKARKVILDNAKKKLEEEKPIQQWNKEFLEKHLQDWKTSKDGRYKRYCMIAVWFLNQMLTKPHYNR